MKSIEYTFYATKIYKDLNTTEICAITGVSQAAFYRKLITPYIALIKHLVPTV